MIREEQAWTDLVTPLTFNFNEKPAPPSQFQRAKVRKNLFDKMEKVAQDITAAKKEEKEEDVEKLEDQKKRVRAELKQFHDEELELVKEGGESLLTCRHCHFIFSCYRTYAKHRCHLIRKPEDSDAPHFRLVEGRDMEQFLNSIQYLSPRRRIQACVSTRTACRGVFPLVFPKPGDTSLSVLEEVACVGEQAYTSLYDALRDGELWLPEKLVLDLPEGGEMFLPPALLTPRQSVKRPEVALTLEEDDYLHLELAQESPSSEDEDQADEAEKEDNSPHTDDEDSGDEEDEDEYEGQYWGDVEGGGGQAGAVGGQAGRRAGQGPPSSAAPPGAPTVQDRRV